MISVENLSIQFNGYYIFKNVSFLVNPKDRIGLVGKNGAGKTTLLKTFKKMVLPDEGEVVVPDGIRLGYLPQQMIIRDNTTLLKETLSAFNEINTLKKEIQQLNIEISHREDYESKAYLNLIQQLTEKNDRFHLLEGTNIEARAEQVLKGLGFEPGDFHRATKEFSGGWRMRIELAKILLQSPDVFLFDEPTNHLDIESIQWLEEFLQNYSGAAIIISHDRAFLDNVTNRTVEISMAKIYDYSVPYSKYVEQRKERREHILASYRNQQKQIEETKEFIERFRYKATKAVQVQSRIKQLDKLDIIEIDEEDKSAIKIKFPPAPRSGTIVFEADNLSKSYPGIEVLKNIDLIIERGERVAFIGKNGAGKTTLSKIIMGTLDCTGTARIGHNVKIGYFAQNQDELMDESKTVLETIDAVAVGDIRSKIRDILGAFLFSGEDVDKKVKVLSGGERSRLALARLLLKPYNLLLLDEPTNHLDMHSKDVLKQALLNYDGTLIVVSHDREFLEGLTQKLFEFKDKKIREFRGGIYEFLQKKKIASLKDLEKKDQVLSPEDTKTSSDNKIDFLKKKEWEKEVRKLNNQITKTETEIEELENSLESMDNILSTGENSETLNNPDLFTQYESIRKNLEEKMKNWEDLHNKIEQLKNKGF
ncbi:MAG: ABC-F family ATP-binding cassette domain-containing protein [Bacteroidales bacterium]|nr:ABC-F family ATP-binding cassette domain-containing protein [Bacteroidales bacterium]